MGYSFLLPDLFPLHTLFAMDTVVFSGALKTTDHPKKLFWMNHWGIRAGVAECHRDPASAKFITAHGGASAVETRSLFFRASK